jgi:hypothetical protein
MSAYMVYRISLNILLDASRMSMRFEHTSPQDVWTKLTEYHWTWPAQSLNRR